MPNLKILFYDHKKSKGLGVMVSNSSNFCSSSNSSYFGVAVFLNVDTLYASDPFYNSYSGIVYFFTKPQVTTGQ